MINNSFVKGMADEIPLDQQSTSATLVLEVVHKWTRTYGKNFGSWTALSLAVHSFSSLNSIYFLWNKLLF